ncbi:MAG: transglycosylase domain-containing protein, partial [Myxococcales bacterium]|nr:transglycosylase domain-containing protein [Myxococcales bacterium]
DAVTGVHPATDDAITGVHPKTGLGSAADLEDIETGEFRTEDDETDEFHLSADARAKRQRVERSADGAASHDEDRGPSIVAGTIVHDEAEGSELGGTGSTGTTRSVGPEGVIPKRKAPSYRDLGVAPRTDPPPRASARPGRGRAILFRVLRRLLIALIILGFLGALSGVAGVIGIFWYYGRGVEGVDVAAIRNYKPKQVSKITARDGTVIGELYSERRTLVQIEDIPKHVELAFLAAEDADFRHHEGMDYMG